MPVGEMVTVEMKCHDVNAVSKQSCRVGLTCLGRDFPFLDEDTVGDLRVLIPQDLNNSLAYVFDLPDDIEDIQTALGVEAIEARAVYVESATGDSLSKEDGISKQFRKFAAIRPIVPPNHRDSVGCLRIDPKADVPRIALYGPRMIMRAIFNHVVER